MFLFYEESGITELSLDKVSFNIFNSFASEKRAVDSPVSDSLTIDLANPKLGHSLFMFVSLSFWQMR